VKRYVIRWVSLTLGLGLMALVGFHWRDITQWGDREIGPGMGGLAGGMAVFFVLLVTVITHSLMILTVRIARAPDWRMSDEQRRNRAAQEAQAALRRGLPAEAIRVYEEAGLFGKALEVAEQTGDGATQARLLTRLGNFVRARKICLQIREFDKAGHLSLLMNEPAQAREYYAQAAQVCHDRNGKALDEAALWDRSGDRRKAAELYEQGGDPERAAECHELLGRRKQATRCRDQARAVAAFERKRAGLSLADEERQTVLKKAAASKRAAELEAVGDFFGAALDYRYAGRMLEAAMAFERMEEWERAASAYEAAGLADRAEIARSHARAPELDEDETGAGGGLAPPPPDKAGAQPFNPVTQVREIPVYIAASGKNVIDLAEQEQMFQLARRNRFAEAAEHAARANLWLMAGAFYECGGQMVLAADIYRRIGRMAEAAECLRGSGRPREAAMIHLAEGRVDQAVRLLVDALKEESGQEEAGLLLAELMIERGMVEEAHALLTRRLAPHGVGPDTAGIYYRFARLFEDKGCLRAALRVYEEMIGAGASSPDLNERAQRLQSMVGKQPEAPSNATTDNVGLRIEDAQLPEVERGFTQAIAAPAETRSTPPLDVSGRVSFFDFAPPADLAFEPEGTAIMDGHDLMGFGRPLPDLSLFGAPPAATATDEATEQRTAAIPDGDAGGARMTAPSLAVSGKPARRRSADPFRPGLRYERRREIARGGMGVVYEAMDMVLQRPVALKLLLDQSITSEGLRQFLLEARAIAQLAHPHVVTIYDIGLMGLRHYIAMEFVRGGSLSQLLRDRGPLSLAEALRLFVETARGLQAAHQAGVVHRDIKPGNLLLTDAQHVKIVDFGLAKVTPGGGLREGAPGEDTQFRSSGTPGYMAPEQIHGEKLGPPCDIYALGITLFCMLAGMPPHRYLKIENDFDIMRFQTEGRLPSLKEARRETPEAIDRLYRYCVASAPGERYQSVDAFLPTAEQWLARLTA